MRCFLSILVLAVLAVVMVACEQQISSRELSQSALRQDAQVSEEPQSPGGLDVNGEPLLLLDNGAEEFLLPTGTGADNSRCFVCHLNYMQEDIALIHARVNIGCANCHGESDEHIADESWASGGNGTAPDIMYPREKINSFCMGCHPRDKIDAVQHESFFAGTAEEKYCTDCHGEHRLARRRLQWK